MLVSRTSLAVALYLAALAGPTLADDWIAERLRGAVFTFTDSGWVELHRGDLVPDGQVVRTEAGGRVTLVRGAESVALAPNTQIEINDRDGKQYTTVKQAFGTVEIEAEVRNVEHFAVVTPHLAAVVKGTRFVVTSGRDSGKVEVTRGKVDVEDMVFHSAVAVPAGHWVMTNGEAPLVLDGGDVAANGQGHGKDGGNSGNGVGNGGGDGSNGHGAGGGNSGNGGGNGGGDGSNAGGNGNGNGKS